MIIWITGERGSGKTTLAKQMRAEMPRAIMLDGDDMRESISVGLGFERGERMEHNGRVARLAKKLEAQGFPIIVSTICPEYCRDEVWNICRPRWIHL